MKKANFLRTLFVGLLLTLLILASGTIQNAVAHSFTNIASSQDTKYGISYETIFFIPKGENGIHYEGENITEMLTWGPTAFAVAPDGTFWIIDATVNQLLQFSRRGDLLSKLNLSEYSVMGATDLEVSDSIIWLLDTAAMVPTVIQLSTEGKMLATYELPIGLRMEDGVNGIALGEQGELLVEREGGFFLAQFLNVKGEVTLASRDGYSFGGHVYAAHPADLNTEDKSHGSILIDGIQQIQVTVNHNLGGLRMLGAVSDGSFYVIVEELVFSPAIQVDQTIRHYDAKGNLLGVSRLPVDDQYTSVAHNLILGPNGAVYALLTRQEGIYVVRLNFADKLEPILPPKSEQPSSLVQASLSSAKIQKPKGDIFLEPEACRSRDTIMTTANSFKQYGRNLTSANVDGACASREKPSYLGGPGFYISIPYDWGGFDNLTTFGNNMNSGLQAGDTSTDSSQSCSRGVDCGGFVSRTWGLSSSS